MGEIRIVRPGKTPGYPYSVWKNISIFHGCMVWIEKSVTRDHCSALLGKPRDAEQ